MPPIPYLDEETLCEAFARGDEAAFRSIVEGYGGRVLNTCLGMLRSVQDAEDLTQEVFVRVYERRDQFRGEARLSTWIYRITVNLCLAHLRKARRQKRFAFLTSLWGDDGTSLRHDAPDYVHPGILAEQQEEAALLFRAIDHLPDKQRAVFVLVYVEGLPQTKVAATLESSVGAVESLLQRAKQRLRQELGPYFSVRKPAKPKETPPNGI